jgi:hypothetical protein
MHVLWKNHAREEAVISLDRRSLESHRRATSLLAGQVNRWSFEGCFRRTPRIVIMVDVRQ